MSTLTKATCEKLQPLGYTKQAKKENTSLNQEEDKGVLILHSYSVQCLMSQYTKQTKEENKWGLNMN